MSRPRPLRLLAYTDSRQLGGAEIALGYLLGALAPEIEVGVLSVDAAVGEAIALEAQAAAPELAPTPTDVAAADEISGETSAPAEGLEPEA